MNWYMWRKRGTTGIVNFQELRGFTTRCGGGIMGSAHTTTSISKHIIFMMGHYKIDMFVALYEKYIAWR